MNTPKEESKCDCSERWGKEVLRIGHWTDCSLLPQSTIALAVAPSNISEEWEETFEKKFGILEDDPEIRGIGEQIKSFIKSEKQTSFNEGREMERINIFLNKK